MKAVNVELIDRDGRTLMIRGCRGKEEIDNARRYLNKEAVNRDFREPFIISTKKMI